MAAHNRRAGRSGSSPLGYRTMQGGAFELLRDWILDGSLKPGQKLPIRDLARGLQLSTMPIREALVRLEATGFVTQEPHRGYKVADLAVRDLHDYYNVRAIVEVEAARQGAAVIDEDGVRELRRVIDALDMAVHSNDIPAVLALDEDFLAVIYAAVRNRALVDLIHGMWDRVRPYKLLFTSIEHGMGANFVIDDDRELLAACESHDGTRAAKVLAASLKKAHIRLTALLELHEHARTVAGADGANDDESLASLCRRLTDSAGNE